MSVYIKNASGEFIEVNPSNFNYCKFRSDPVITIVDSTCCKSEAKLHYTCKKLDIKNLSYEDCQSCKFYEKKVG